MLEDIDPFSAEANALSTPPGEYGRKAETQKIDGDPHKQWSMLLNSMLREEPYLGLTSGESLGNRGVPSGTPRQVLHGCCQLVS